MMTLLAYLKMAWLGMVLAAALAVVTTASVFSLREAPCPLSECPQAQRDCPAPETAQQEKEKKRMEELFKGAGGLPTSGGGEF